MIRLIVRLWNWFHTPRMPRYDHVSSEWQSAHRVRAYDDNPRAKAARWE